jgi:hypothetical protein
MGLGLVAVFVAFDAAGAAIVGARGIAFERKVAPASTPRGSWRRIAPAKPMPNTTIAWTAAAMAAFAAAAPAQLPPSIALGNLGNQGITIGGATAGEKLGVNVRGGFDWNGDGLADMALGASLASPMGRFQAGQVTVVFGSANAPASIDLANATIPTTTILGAAPDDRTGIWIASGFDWNADGFDDLAIGAWLADPAGRADAGIVTIVLGSAQPPRSIDLAAASPSIRKIFGARPGDGLGLAIEPAGDVDGDGLLELVVGAPFANANNKIDAGIGYIVRGGSPSIDLLSPGSSACAILGKGAGDQNARSVAGRLIVANARAVALGAQFADPLGRVDAGEVAVVPIPWPFPASIDLNQPPAGTIFIAGPAPGAACGITAANAGDRNGNNTDEVACGSWRAPGPTGNTGRVDVVELAGAPAIVDLANTTNGGLTIFGAQQGAMAGNVVGDSFDADADGFPDLLLGMRAFDSAPNLDVGCAVLLRRPAGFAASAIDLAAPPPEAHFFVGVDSSDFCGYDARSAGDANGDGVVDSFAGALNATPGATPHTGAAYVVFSRTTIAPPSIVGIAPASGDFGGGAIVAIAAQDLVTAGNTTITFGAVPSPWVSVVNSTLAAAAVPPGAAPGAVDVTIRNANGASTLAAGFVYKPALGASIFGSAAGGGILTLQIAANAGGEAWPLYALGASAPFAIPPFAYALALDPATLGTLGGPAIVTSPTGELRIETQFSPLPQLAGTTIHLQALVVQSAGAAFTNAVSVTLPAF